MSQIVGLTVCQLLPRLCKDSASSGAEALLKGDAETVFAVLNGEEKMLFFEPSESELGFACCRLLPTLPLHVTRAALVTAKHFDLSHL